MRSVVQDHLPGLKSSEVFYGFRKGVDENENAEGMNAQRARRQGRDTEPKNRTGCLAAQKDRRVGKHRAKERTVAFGGWGRNTGHYRASGSYGSVDKMDSKIRSAESRGGKE